MERMMKRWMKTKGPEEIAEIMGTMMPEMLSTLNPQHVMAMMSQLMPRMMDRFSASATSE